MSNPELIRAEIRAGRCKGHVFRDVIFKESGLDPDVPGEIGYDELDEFVNGLLSIAEMPTPTVDLTAEMVEFYKTPARVVVELAEQVNWEPDDVFYDLGAGLGQVVILVNILTGVAARGVEIEPVYCEYAQDCASEMGLSRVEFVEADVRDADLSSGTVFFLFTPFKGEMFLQVMERLRVLASTRRIRVIGYGPCSAEIARLGWLRREGEEEGGEYSLKIFSSYGQPPTCR